ncbi:MAG: hypothetical protein LBV69_01115 [Bacteroidales bacterium]|jgi:hypothetical protein|nr:hypothetical protein [Bacteroidales bacterium]
MKKSTSKNIALLLIFSTLMFQFCSNAKIEYLKDKIKFETINSNNDSVSFFITQIDITDYERGKDRWIEAVPNIGLNIKIMNKTNKILYFQLFDYYFNSNFVGIIENKRDTAYFTGEYNDKNYLLLSPKDSAVININTWLFHSLFDFDQYGDNTKFLLNLIKDMDFYYLPDTNVIKNNNLDTIMLCNKYRLGISFETKFKTKIIKW